MKEYIIWPGFSLSKMSIKNRISYYFFFDHEQERFLTNYKEAMTNYLFTRDDVARYLELATSILKKSRYPKKYIFYVKACIRIMRL